MANAVASLSEIGETSTRAAEQVKFMTPPTINKLLTALNECTEWGQIFILDAIANYPPEDAREAQRCVSFLICKVVLLDFLLDL